MPWRGAEYEGEFPSVGWIFMQWAMDHLPSPADEKQPLIYTPEQARLLVRWFRIDPETCKFAYRRGAAEMLKGWGKSPLFAAVALGEFAGPVIPDGWDARGEPVARPWGTGGLVPSWVQIAAVSEDQTDNTYGALYELLTANEHKAAIDLGIDDGRTRLYFRGGRRGRVEPVTSSAGSREGQRVTFAVLDETHLWTPQSGGVRLAGTLRRNVAKMGGRSFETTNAPVLGERSVAEATGKDAEAGKRGILFYAVRPAKEPDPSMSDAELVEVVREVRGDATWLDPDRSVAEIRDPQTEWGDALRFNFNIRTPGGGKAVDPRRWDELADTKREVLPGTPIGIGFDGSVSQDSTVLRGCTRDGFRFTIEHWNRPAKAPRDWRVPRPAVHEALARAFEVYRVGLMLCDPAKWWSEIDEWARAYGEKRVLAFDTNQESRFAKAVDRWLTGIREGKQHDGDSRAREHVTAANKRKARVRLDADDDRTLYVLVKGDDGRKIDAAIADVLALEAAETMPEPPSRGKTLAMVTGGGI